MTDPRRALPSVRALLDTTEIAALATRTPRPLLVAAIRETIERARREPSAAPDNAADWSIAVATTLAALQRASLRPVLNGTGVILHTNLGRAPLADSAITAIAAVAAGYSTLEYDVASGERGSRYTHCTALLRELTGAEDALVVNNGAAALVLALNTIADGRTCIVSRGELVEIGGSFRVPDIMTKSGARLVEIGTTNRTHMEDYRGAIGPDTAAIVKVHRSNFSMEGFVAEVPANGLADLADAHHLSFIHDLGSGLLMPLDELGLTGEPTAAEALRGRATVVTMSGDKLLGGPQAGIILGPREMVSAMRANPLTRAFRVGKSTLAALEATLMLYRDPHRALREIPVLAQLATPVAELRSRGAVIHGELRASDAVSLTESHATVGGGAFPAARILSIALALRGDAGDLERRLRLGDPAVIARIEDDRVLIDLRTIHPRDDTALTAALSVVLSPDAA